MISRKTSALPEKIYLVNSKGYYYSVERGAVALSKKVPDLSCVVTVEYLPSDPDQFYLLNAEGGYFKYHHRKNKGSHIDHKPAKKKKFEKYRIPFTLLNLEQKDTFVFRSSKGSFMVLAVNAKKRIGLGGFESAKIMVRDPAIQKKVSDIAYNLNASKITALMPEDAFKTSVRNDSQSDSTQALTYSYLVSHIGGWTNSIGATLPPQAVAMAKVPCLVDGKIAISENFSHAGTPNAVEKTATSSVSVPARTRGIATVLISKARIQVAFTYIETIWYESGQVSERVKRGIYENIVIYGVDIKIKDIISL